MPPMPDGKTPYLLFARINTVGDAAAALAACGALADRAMATMHAALVEQLRPEPYGKFPGTYMTAMVFRGPDLLAPFDTLVAALGGGEGWYRRAHLDQAWAVWNLGDTKLTGLDTARWLCVEVEPDCGQLQQA